MLKEKDTVDSPQLWIKSVDSCRTKCQQMLPSEELPKNLCVCVYKRQIQALSRTLEYFDYFYFMCATTPIGGNKEQNAFLLQCIWIYVFFSCGGLF